VTRNEARIQNAANLLAGGTGLVYVWLKYFADKDPSALAHPAEPSVQALHVVLSPLLIFAVGLIWRDHVLRKLRRLRRRGRASGILILVLFPPMALSAYMIQVTVDEVWRQGWVVAHLVTSGLWIAGYVVHLVTKPSK
jgi:hypothetical protein